LPYEDDVQRSEAMVAIILHFLMTRGIQSGGVGIRELNTSEELKAFFPACMSWLKAEGLIRFSRVKQYSGLGFVFFDPCLTSRGFALMDARFDYGNRKLTIGQAVEEVSEGGNSFSKLGDFVGGILGGLTKSLGSS
jgi:hypothetical protein